MDGRSNLAPELRPTGRPTLSARVLELRQQGSDLIRPMGLAPIPRGPVLRRFDDGAEWAVLDVALDPHLEEKRMAMPRSAQRHLARVHRRGISFDRLYVAHELPAGSVATIAKQGSLDMDALVKAIGEPTSDPRVEVLADRTAAVAAGVGTGAIAIGVVCGLAIAAVALAPLVAGAALLGAVGAAGGLDPAIIGVISPSGRAEPGELGVFFHVVSWS